MRKFFAPVALYLNQDQGTPENFLLNPKQSAGKEFGRLRLAGAPNFPGGGRMRVRLSVAGMEQPRQGFETRIGFMGRCPVRCREWMLIR
jgi:hypothetical protein